MINRVHIPVHDDNPLTLKTIKIGFPATVIEVHHCNEFGTNDRLIKRLVETETEGFAVIDSDVVFFDNCENYDPSGLIAGEFIPEFVCPIANAITRSRLHTAFFVVPDPVKLRRQIELAHKPVIPKFCPFDPFSPVVTFQDHTPYFHDSCSVLYHAVGGEKFGPDMLRRFEHVYSGSYATGLQLDRLKAAYDNPESARGIREMMGNYFEKRKP